MRNFNITVNGQIYSVSVDELGGSAAPVAVAFAPAPTAAPAPAAAPVPAPTAAPASVVADGTKVNSPMPGNILDVVVKEGDHVEVGDKLIVLEAMKMENDINTSVAGTVATVAVRKGDVVSTNDLLVVIA